MCFLHICLRLFVFLFQIECLISRSGYALYLCVLFIADTNPREPCVSSSLKVGVTFLILSYSKAKKNKSILPEVRFHTVTLSYFDFPLKLFQVLTGYALFSIFFLPARRALGSEKSPCFSSNVWFDPGSSIKPL